MPIDYAYPPQLAQYLRQEWERTGDAPPLMDQDYLERVLTVAYQASLLREEDRTVRVRMVIAEPEAFDPLDGPPQGLQVLAFDAPLPFTPDELRRLALAAKYHRAIVGLRALPDGQFVIWGLLQSGPGWIQVAQGGRGPAPTPPAGALIIRVLGPGRLAVGRGALTLAELRGGIVGGPGMDVFDAQWLRARFISSRSALMAQYEEARANAKLAGAVWADVDEEVFRRASQAMVRRFLAAMVAAHHGGTVILLAPEKADAIVRGGPLRLKYAFRDTEARRRYLRIVLALMQSLAAAGGAAGLARVDRDNYGTLKNAELARLQDAVFEMSQLIAALTEIDGAVVMTKRFELLGFGAEIAGDLPDVQLVARALDLEAVDRVLEPLNADGTRHRSAYRLCSRVPDALAVVVSQDGGVRFIAAHQGEVTFWEHAIEALDV